MTKDELKQQRKALGMTQDEFARFLGYNSGRYVRALESGERAITDRTENLVNLLVKEKAQ